jgi:hypothetical protein
MNNLPAMSRHGTPAGTGPAKLALAGTTSSPAACRFTTEWGTMNNRVVGTAKPQWVNSDNHRSVESPGKNHALGAALEPLL